jgi:hypothetical protein
MKLTTHLHLVPRSRMRGAIPQLLQYAFMALCSVKSTGTALPFASMYYPKVTLNCNLPSSQVFILTAFPGVYLPEFCMHSLYSLSDLHVQPIVTLILQRPTINFPEHAVMPLIPTVQGIICEGAS